MPQFIFSTSLDGKIKAWLYDNMGSRVDYEAPGRWCTTMAYSADGMRLIRTENFSFLLADFNLALADDDDDALFSHCWCLSCRLFSCGTSKEGETHIVEWNESEGSIKRTYVGFWKRSMGVVQFDTTRNRYLAAGDECMIKFWDMDSSNMLTTTDAGGGLPVILWSSMILFNFFYGKSFRSRINWKTMWSSMIFLNFYDKSF